MSKEKKKYWSQMYVTHVVRLNPVQEEFFQRAYEKKFGRVYGVITWSIWDAIKEWAEKVLGEKYGNS